MQAGSCRRPEFHLPGLERPNTNLRNKTKQLSTIIVGILTTYFAKVFWRLENRVVKKSLGLASVRCCLSCEALWLENQLWARHLLQRLLGIRRHFFIISFWGKTGLEAEDSTKFTDRGGRSNTYSLSCGDFPKVLQPRLPYTQPTTQRHFSKIMISSVELLFLQPRVVALLPQLSS